MATFLVGMIHRRRHLFFEQCSNTHADRTDAPLGWIQAW